jgi:DNA-binding CsgD family transcriptional regulator
MRGEAANQRSRNDADHGLSDAVAAGDWPTAAAIMERWGVELQSGIHRSRFFDAVARTPEKLLSTHPGILFWAEAGRVRSVSAEPTTFDTARLAAGGEAGLIEMRRIAAAVIARRSRGFVAEAVAILEDVMPAVRTAIRRQGDLPITDAAWFFMQAGITYDVFGDIHTARRNYLLAWQRRGEDQVGLGAQDIPAKLAVLAAIDGDHAEVRRWIDVAVRPPIADPLGLGTDLGYPLAEFIVAIDRIDFETSDALLPHIALPTEFEEFFHYLVWARAHRLLVLGRIGEVLRLIDETAVAWDDLVAGNGWYQTHFIALRAKAFLAGGRVDEAEATLDSLSDSDDGIVLLWARAGALRLHFDAALEHLAGISDRPPRRVQLEAQLLAAACHLNQGQISLARSRFQAFVASVGDNLQSMASISETHLRGLFALLGSVPAANALQARWHEHRHLRTYPYPETSISVSDREFVVLRRLARGESRAEIANAEFVSANTVKTQVAALYRKFNATNRSELVAKALSQGLLTGSRNGITEHLSD